MPAGRFGSESVGGVAWFRRFVWNGHRAAREVCVVACSMVAAMCATGGVPATSDTHVARMAWFRDAKFGLFVHWGLYSIPAGSWNGRRSPGYAEHVMKMMRVPRREYERLAAEFNSAEFDADAWVEMAIDAGMRYMVVTAKHHDGFAMFDSGVSTYDVVDATPGHRDLLKELAAACARRKFPLGFYYSHAQDWAEAGGLDNDWDFPTNAQKESSGAFDRYLRTKAEPQIRELLTNYGPVCLLWFDTPHLMTDERAGRFVELVRGLQPSTLINGRLNRGNRSGDYVTTGDNEVPDIPKGVDFEVPATINQSWGFRRDDEEWKPPREILFHLVDVTSKGGNYLLNVGPDATGVVPEPARRVLRSVGAWLRVNGEAIYGAGRSPFGAEFGEYVVPVRNPGARPEFLARRSWRCTTRPGRLYFTMFTVDGIGKTAGARLALPEFRNPITAAYMLNDPARAPLAVRVEDDGSRTLIVSTFINVGPPEVAVVEIAGDTVEL